MHAQTSASEESMLEESVAARYRSNAGRLRINERRATRISFPLHAPPGNTRIVARPYLRWLRPVR